MAGIYIHIPFCRQICNYCDFHHSASLLRVDEIVASLAQELRERVDFMPRDCEVETIYFGGGTPSILPPSQIGLLIDICCELWGPRARFREITLEANPEDLTEQYLSDLQKVGVNRLSIGIQSFDDEHLKLMNRRHSADQAQQAVELARKIGFDNITIDLMYGLPFMSPQQWSHNIQQAVELGVDHISAYHLTVEPRTVFGKRKLQGVDDGVSELHFAMLREALLQAGYEHYEVSNFAQPNKRSIHNSNYWMGVPYLGIGPSAHSFDGHQKRCWNPSSNKQYLEGVGAEYEILSPTDKRNEMVMTRLRTADGLHLNQIEDPSERERIISKAQSWINRGKMQLMEQDGDLRLFILPQYFLISDSVIADFFE